MNAVGMLRGAWEHRGFIAASVKREFASRYLGTQLGLFWAVAQPLALIAVYTVVFAEIMKPVLPGHDSRFAYGIFLTSGIVLWGLFSELLSRLIGVFVQNANILKKVSVPKVTLPIVAVLNALLHFGIVVALFLGFLSLVGTWPGRAVVALVPVVAITVALALGLGVLLATVNVFYRDIEHSMALILNFWFWLTPIVYPSRALPDAWKAVLDWNPIAPLVRAVQAVFLDAHFPDWACLAYPAGLAVVLLVAGGAAFARLSGEIVDEL
jgi:lipopolysaccharide transport system permease protein